VNVKNSPLISVVICTHNRSHLLQDVIETVCLQSVAKDSYEVIIVDNRSVDETRLVVDLLSHKFANIHYLYEPIVGLSHARNCGWRNAKGDYVFYLDDDGRASDHWLPVGMDIIQNISPAVFGGPYFAYYNSPKPDWFRDSYESFTSGNQGRALDDGFLSGGNIAFRRSVLEQLGGFDSNLGMRGNQRGYAEETALIRLIRQTEPSAVIYYDPRFYIYHLVAPQKMRMSYNIRARFDRGRYAYLIGLERFGKSSTAKLAIEFVRSIMSFIGICASSIKRDRDMYPFRQNYIYECGLRRIVESGILYEQLKASLFRAKKEGI
jgi:glycosyltransferase involved in cell wall biosynthesis